MLFRSGIKDPKEVTDEDWLEDELRLIDKVRGWLLWLRDNGFLRTRVATRGARLISDELDFVEETIQKAIQER